MTEANRVLLIFSGGFDSTACLIKLLKETDYPLDVLRIETKDRRLEVTEKYATEEIIKYLKDPENGYREFDFYTRKMDYPVVNMYTARKQLAAWCNMVYRDSGKKYKYVSIGRMKDDDENETLAEAFPDPDKKFYTPLHDDLQDIEFYYPIVDMYKTDVINYIPSVLYQYIATCRQPRFVTKTPNGKWQTWYKPCANCYSCFKIKEAIVKDPSLQVYPSLMRYCLRK